MACCRQSCFKSDSSHVEQRILLPVIALILKLLPVVPIFLGSSVYSHNARVSFAGEPL